MNELMNAIAAFALGACVSYTVAAVGDRMLQRADRRRRDRLDAILRALAAAPDGANATDLARAVQRNAGTIYVDLARLEQAGRITAWWETPEPADRPRRRIYGLEQPWQS